MLRPGVTYFLMGNLEQTLTSLLKQREQINTAIASIQALIGGASVSTQRSKPKWSPKAKAAVSKRMKAYWAGRRKKSR
jgi:hypothetical protein